MSEAGKRILKRTSVVILLIIIILVVPLITIQYLKGDKIKQLIVTELNKHLTTEISVSSINIGIFRTFPYASLILKGVIIKPPVDMPAAPALLKADKIYLKFNVLNLFTGRFTIHSVAGQKASISIFNDGHGRNNYSIWKSNTGGANEPVKFDIKKLTLINSEIVYQNISKSDNISFAVNTLDLNGTFGNDLYQLKVKANCFTNYLIISGDKVINPGLFKIASQLNINSSDKFLEFMGSQLDYADISTSFSGKINYSDTPTTDLLISALTGKIEKLLNIVPENYSKEFTKYNPKGDINLSGSLKGNTLNANDLTILINYKILKGSAEIAVNKRIIESIESNGSFYYYGENKPEVLNITKISGNVKSAAFKGNGTIRNFSNPSVNFELHAKGNIEEFDDLIENKEFSNFKGNLVADVTYKGTYYNEERIDRFITGQLVLADAGFKYKTQTITNLNGATEFRDNKIFFNGLTFEIGNSDLKANGYLSNLTNYLFDKNQQVYASLNLQAEKIVLDDLLQLVQETGTENNSGSIFPPLIAFDANVSVNQLIYKKLNTKHITGVFALKDNVLRGNNILIEALDGNITANGVINGRYGNRAQIITSANFKGVDINKLFYQFNEFGQKSLVSHNLQGIADAKVDFSTSLNRDYTVNSESVEAIADIEIRNGELNNFKPLQALSRFLDAKELSNVKFATLKNRIEISHKTVYIPKMEISSSALDLIGYGTHSFSNNIDYHVNMLLSDVLKAKRKKQTDLTNYIEDDGYGKPRLFLKMTGPINDPIIKYDTKAVRNKIENDLKNEKQVFREVIQKEFGREKPTSVPKSDPVKQSPEFQIEWDELK